MLAAAIVPLEPKWLEHCTNSLGRGADRENAELKGADPDFLSACPSLDDLG